MMEDNDADVNLTCSFAKFTTSSCGNHSDYPNENNLVLIKDCNKDISNHLYRCKLGKCTSLIEGLLVCCRVGIFSYMKDYSVCPHHRYSLGLKWKKMRVLCACPDHTGKAKPETDRSATLQMSQHILRSRGVVVPVGSGICRNCRGKLSEEIDSSRWPALEEITTTVDGAKSEENTTDVSYNLRRLPTPNYGNFERGQISSSQESESILSQESNWSETSAAEEYLKHGLENINKSLHILGRGSISPIKFQLKTSLDKVSQSTVRYMKRKSSETVHMVLEHIAPGQSSKLLRLLLEESSCGTPSCLQSPVDSDLTEMIVKLYHKANNNALKCQLLSMISAPQMHSKSELQKFIPGLTKWKIDQSRAHSTRVGAGVLPLGKSASYRNRMDEDKLEHALGFFLSPNFIEICSYGNRTLKFDNGDQVTIPEVVRTSCHSSLIVMYKTFCQENNFIPLSDSTLYKILDTCSAAKRSNLSGLDNTAQDGAVACDSLLKTVETLVQYGLSKEDSDEMKSAIKSLKLYLKGEYKVNIEMSSTIEDHCIKLALSNPSDIHFQDYCDHQHDGTCGKCGLLYNIKHDIHDALCSVQDLETAEDIKSSADFDIQKIEQWKSHILRAKNQNECRFQLMETLKAHQMILVMDWAMKFLPLLYREKQSDFYGQKGLNWHVTVGILKCPDGSLKHKTFTHLFNGVKQDWFAVASILEHTLSTIKIQNPEIEEVFLRSDNAGCFHCGSLWLALQGIGERTGINILRYDYSEAQAGKSVCDSKIAHMRCKMKMFVASGGNITTAEDMKTAIMSGSGVSGCQCAVVSVDTTKQNVYGHGIKGVNKISNLEFRGDRIIHWQAFNIGIGQVIERSDVIRQIQGETGLLIHSDFTELPSNVHGNIKSSRPNKEIETGNRETGEDQTSNEESSTNCSSDVFYCPESGCIKTYTSHSALEKHILLDRHTFECAAKMSTYDQIRKKWTETCYANLEIVQKVSVRVSVRDNANDNNMSIDNDGDMGWALKKERKFTRFSQNVKSYLQEVFNAGNETGRKVNPCDVCKTMKLIRNENGERRFARDECLTTSQINSYFSRLALLNRKDGAVNASSIETLEDEDLQIVVSAIEDEELRNTLNANLN